MLIRLDDIALVDDLRTHYLRSAFRAESVGGCMIEVGRPGSSPDQEHREVMMHLRVWQVSHPESIAEIV